MWRHLAPHCILYCLTFILIRNTVLYIYIAIQFYDIGTLSIASAWIQPL